MFDSDTFTKDMLSNPTKMLKVVVDAMEKADTTGETLINDPNNGFVLQLASYLSVQSKLSEKVDYVYSYLYPMRARNAEQLYPHLSEFDYVKLMASPATLPFVFRLSADWIRSVGVYYDTNYDRLVIPETSYVTVGGIVYSMYYPIEIFINRNTGAITAYYDGSFTNELYTLESNMLPDVQEYTQDGVRYFQIQFNMFQFERDVKTFTIGTEQGFIKTLPFTDQFYAVKLSSLDRNGNWVKLNYSLSQLYYDFETPTALLTLLSDQSQLKIKIPQVYFDNNQISKSIKIELYTSKGAVNYSLSLSDLQNVEANFDTTSSDYAAPFEQAPIYELFPTTTEVAGGSNALSYEETRDVIVNKRFKNGVAITIDQVIQAARDAGFSTMTKVKDDLTDRIFFASNVLTDSNDVIIPTFTGSILIADDALNGNPKTIINYTDGYYTILPTTIFKTIENVNTCVPLSDGEVTTMQAMTKTQLVTELNNGNYVRQPFHVTLKTDRKSPQALVYNLLAPTMTSLVFVAENAHSAPQMSVTLCDVVHLYNGTGGYQFGLGITRSSNIEDDDPASFVVIVSCVTKNGGYVYLPASFVQKNNNGIDEWLVSLETNYHITDEDYITVKMYNATGTLVDVEISLNQTFSVTTGFVRTYDPTVPVDNSLNAYLPVNIRSGVTAMARQTMKIALGRNLSTQIYSGVHTNWGNDVYKTADDVVYYNTNIPIFQTTTDLGVINTRINSDTQHTEVVLIYPQGSIPSSVDDLTVTVTANKNVSSSTTTTLAISSTVGLLPGMKARGENIPAGAIITAIGNQSVTLSKKITKTITKNTKLIFTNPSPVLTTSIVQSQAGDLITVADTSNLLVGQSVFGFDIPADAKVKQIVSATTFRLTIPTVNKVAINTLLTIINTTAPGVVRQYKGDVLTDATGQPIIVKRAQNQYSIPAILFDGRLFASEDSVDQTVITTIGQRLNNYANQINTIDADLTENSDVYYRPARSMGSTTFRTGGDALVTMSLELSFSVIVYVDISVYNTQALLAAMENTIFTVINAYIQEPIISVSILTDLITEKLGTNAVAVEMGPISGKDGLRLIARTRADVIPSIENKLIIETDGHIKRIPNINISYVPKPSTILTNES